MDFREMTASTTPHYFVFTVDGHSSDARFKVWYNQMRLEYTDVDRRPRPEDVCIKLVFEPDSIELDNFYYDMPFDKKYMCPPLSHVEFFKILDVVSSMYGTTLVNLIDGSYITVNEFKIPKNVIAMTKGGRSFYNRHGFVSNEDGVDENFRQLPSTVLDEGAAYFGVREGSTFREAAEQLIQRARRFEGTKEERTAIQVRLASFDTRIQIDAHDSNWYHKITSPYEYRIEPLNETTFHVIATSVAGKKRKPKTRNKRRSKSVRN